MASVKAILDKQRNIGEMAALVGYLPSDFFAHITAGVEAVRGGIPKVADVLDLVALVVIGDVPAYFVDEGHASSVAVRDLRHDHVEYLGRKAGKGCHEASAGQRWWYQGWKREVWQQECHEQGDKQ